MEDRHVVLHDLHTIFNIQVQILLEIRDNLINKRINIRINMLKQFCDALILIKIC